MALNAITNKIYVASPETDLVYVIDGITNKIISKIKAGPSLGDMAIDTNEFGGFSSLIFVANQGSNTISVIDDVQGKILANITTNTNPYGIGIDSVQNKAFVTSGINSIDVIDYSTDSVGRKFNASLSDSIDYVGFIPTGIIVTPDTGKAYITNSGTNTVSVIDTVSNRLLGSITVGLFPNSLAFDPINKKIYVSNTGNNTISVIDTTIDDLNKTKEIEVDSISYDIAVNPLTNIVYLANHDSKTISTINGTTDKPVSAVTFNIYPPDAGNIICNNETKPVNMYIRIDSDSQCKAIAKKGFVFDKWSYDSAMNSNYTITNKTLFDAFSLLKSLIFNSKEDYNYKLSNLTDFKYGMPYTANFISSSNILQVGSPYLSVGALLMVILIAAVKPALNKKISIPRKSKLTHNRSISSKEEDEKGILERNDIITIDATIIIGVLIFLSFTEGFETSEQYQITIITASIVFPFALSAIIAATKNKKFATRLMLAGFINLMISVILISIMRL